MSSSSKIDVNEVLRQLRASGNVLEELVEVFSEEAEEHLRSIYDGLDRLRVDANDSEALSDVRRASHTLKGAAGAVGMEPITRVSHRMEDMLDCLVETSRGPSDSQLELFLATTDLMQDLTTSEFDFDEAADTLLGVYQEYDAQMDVLASDAPSDVSEEASPAADDEVPAAEETDDAEELAEEVAVEVAVAEPVTKEISEADLDEIRRQVSTGSKMDPTLVEVFSEEAEEHMRSIYDGLSRIKKDQGDWAAMADIRRASHTLKGAAGAVGAEAVTRLSHRMEDLLDRLTETTTKPGESQVDLLLSTADRLQDLTTASFDAEEIVASLGGIYKRYEEELGSDDSRAAALAALAKSAEAASTTEEEKAPAAKPEPEKKKPAAAKKQSNLAPNQFLRVPIERLDGLVALVGEMIVTRSAFNQRLVDFENRIDDMATSLERLRGVANEVETQYSVEALQRGGRRGVGTNRLKAAFDEAGYENLDSLEFDRYTDFHLLARSLSEATNDVSVVASELRNLHGDFDSLLGRQQRFNRDAQASLMQIRMVPVDNITNRLERTVRSVSNKLGKKVDLIIKGESTELDKTVLEEITDPLLHLIRNGLDHGIENPEDRKAAGKPERSQLIVEALNQGTEVTIRVIDDGRGIDLEKVRTKALERGLVAEDQTLSKEEMHSLIFLPGFSTAESLTDVSGRGVGMDVVRDAVQRLKGTIKLNSEPGQGSTFTIHLPTSLAVTRALLVESNGHDFAIPMQAIQQTMRLDPNQVSMVGKTPMINLGDRTVMLKGMASHLQMKTEDDEFKVASPLLIIRTGDDEVAITVDAVNGGQDIVVKTLGDHLRNVPGYIGATVSGDGTVIPIVDPSDLCGQQTGAAGISWQGSSDGAAMASRNTAMVIDDSLSVRRVTTNLLRTNGWAVIDAKDGVDALEKLSVAATPPDVFLCDMEMPRMDGLELVSRIRSQPEFATTPIIMVTSRAAEKHRKLGKEAGADEHVVKPFNDEQLIGMINRMVNEHREVVVA